MCVRLLALTCALVVVCGVSPAHAAAPMCDHLAQTIAAPAPLKPIPDRKLAKPRCGADLFDRLDAAPAPHEQTPKLSLDVVQRVLPMPNTLSLDSPRTTELIPLERERSAGSSFLAEIYRPPRF